MFKKISRVFINELKKSENAKAIEKIKKAITKTALPIKQTEMILSILDLYNITAREVMVPRINVITYDVESDSKTVEKMLKDTTWSRVPVYAGKIDNIKGILHVKDVYRYFVNTKASSKSSKKTFDLNRYISEAYFVPESKRVLDILSDFQLKHIQMAIVVDEYGGFSGIVTMEDIIEEIIGDVQDEFDDEEVQFKEIDESSYSIDARVDLELFNEYFSMDLAEEEVDTLGGFLINLIGYIPKRGQKIRYSNAEFQIMSKRKNSILRVRMIKLTPPPETPDALPDTKEQRTEKEIQKENLPEKEIQKINET